MSSIESKIVVIGPPDVGKTCLSVRFVRGRFSEHTSTTIGASFLMKTMTSGNVSNTMKIWDTAGQEVFRSMSSLYYKDVDGAILVYDASNPTSLVLLDQWYQELMNNNSDRNVTVFVACNKMDLCPSVDKRLGEQYASSIGARIFFTSAKDGMNVNELFTEMSTSIIKRRCATITYAAQNFGAVVDSSITVSQPENPPEEKKKCCC